MSENPDQRVEAEALTSKMTVTDHAVAVVKRAGQVIGFRESVRRGRAVAADREEDGSVRYWLVGGSPQGEEDTLFAAKTLVKKLNREGASWQMPVPGEGDVDAISVDESDPEKLVQMQVVQAVVDEEFLRQRSRAGGIDGAAEATEVMIQLREAIGHKSQKMPENRRAQLVLVLNAVATGHHAFVVEQFRERYRDWVQAQGFESVWLVGPTPGLTARLD